MSDPTHSLLASEIFALAHESKCQGFSECHWCGAPCGSLWAHDDPPGIVGVKPLARMARRPGNPWICKGCWLWRRQRVTVNYLGGDFKDGQTAGHHSWWIEEKGAWALRKESYPKLYEKLLAPPRHFVLSLLVTDPVVSGAIGLAPALTNHLQHCVANNVDSLFPDTPLFFTVNGIQHQYTVYELEDGLRNGSEGKEPGIGALIRVLGTYPLPPKPGQDNEPRGRGRPPKPEDAKIFQKPIRRV
ncbi:MAG: hypothetical protein KGL39_00240 [Patescibacteria group bacterium]|nr:hypothetical protein [Patescibacteria group bacterium]